MRINLTNKIVHHIENYDSSSIIRNVDNVTSIMMNTNTNFDLVSFVLQNPDGVESYIGIGGLNKNERFIYDGKIATEQGSSYRMYLSYSETERRIFYGEIQNINYYVCVRQKSVQTSEIYIICEEFYNKKKFEIENYNVIIKYDHKNNFFKIIKNEKGFISWKKH